MRTKASGTRSGSPVIRTATSNLPVVEAEPDRCLVGRISVVISRSPSERGNRAGLDRAHRRAPLGPRRRHEEHLLGGRCSRRGDRKSTRLNSSHGYISYALFCFKKKKKKTRQYRVSRYQT